MTIHEHATRSFGVPVVEFDPKRGVTDATSAYRLRIEYDDAEAGVRFSDLLAKFRADPKTRSVAHLVIGSWGEPTSETVDEVVEALVAARGDLPELRTLFLGDVIGEECEISWMRMADVSPLWGAFPGLEGFRIRGTDGLSLGSVRLARLRTLIVESGGLPSAVIDQVLRAQTPELEHLELWLGDDGYGFDGGVETLRPLLDGEVFPKLRTLGLRNSCIADEVARALAHAPILERIETLDLSLGTLGDEGAGALAEAPALSRLKKLDIHHHYVSDAVIEKLRGKVKELDGSERQEPDEWGGEEHRYVAVSE